MSGAWHFRELIQTMAATAINESVASMPRHESNQERSLLRRMFSTEPWVAAVFMILSFVFGVFWFSLLIPLIATGIGTLITLVGIPLLILTHLAWKAGAGVERWRVRAFFGVKIPDPYRPLPAEGTVARIKARMGDPATWKDLAFLILLFPIGIIEFVLTVALVSATFSSLFMPAYFW